MAKSKAPKSGSVKITRDKKKFTAKWSTGETYESQEAAYVVYYTAYVPNASGVVQKTSTNTGWISVNVGKSATDKSFTPNMNQGYIYTKIKFRVRGKAKNKDKSDWTVSDEWEIELPSDPKDPMSYKNASLNPVSLSDARTRFFWEVPVSDTNHKMFDYVQRYRALVPDCNTTNGDQVDWSKAIGGITWYNDTTTASGSNAFVEIEEDVGSWDLENHSYTRWFVVNARGPRGETKEVYAYRTFSRSKPVQEEDTEGEVKPGAGSGITIHVSWSSPWSANFPFEQANLMYAIANPPTSETTTEGDTVKVTLSCPNNVSWQTGKTTTDVKGSSGFDLDLPSKLGNDEVLYCRVDTVHDGNTTPGAVFMPSGAYGTLAAPTGLSVTTPDPDTHRCTVSVTNNSSITGSVVLIYYTSATSSSERIVGVVPHGQSSITCTLPDDSSSVFTLSAKCVVADYSPAQPAQTGVTNYTVSNILMESSTYQQGGSTPQAASGLNVEKDPNSNDTVLLTWNWDWTDANAAEISWSKNKNAWNSTDGPQTYLVENTHSGRWYISGLDTSDPWYFRVRLLKQDSDATIYGAYSDIYPPNGFSLAASPATPKLTVDPEGAVTVNQTVDCYWVYATNDGTPQESAELYEAFINATTGVVTYSSNSLKKVNTSSHISFTPEEFGWDYGQTHYIALRVRSASGMPSINYSDPYALNIRPAPVATITNSSIVSYSWTTTDENDDPVTITEPTLRSLPLTVTVTGAGSSGLTTVVVKRRDSFPAERPDGNIFVGYADEVVCRMSHTGEGQFTINRDDCKGYGTLDDTADYQIIGYIQDENGQTAESTPLDFVVHWDIQPVIAQANIEYDNEQYIAMITPLGSADMNIGDVCDIYRLSIDRPILIIENGEFDKTYVDPYPTLGTYGGYRIVSKTKYGDYRSEEGMYTWMDYNPYVTADAQHYLLDGHVYVESENLDNISDYSFEFTESGNLQLNYDLDLRANFWLRHGDLYVSEGTDAFIKLFSIIIDFDGKQLLLPYDITVSNSWTKDFQETKYLGGSVQGDWYPGVSKTASLTTRIPIEYTPENMQLLSQLAEYAGICHVRIPDGSNYYANVNVKDDRENKQVNQLSKITLTITRVDSNSEDLDGFLLEE